MTAKLTIADYPLAETRSDKIRGQRGKSLDDITLDAVMAGKVTMEDLRITPQALADQAEISRAAKRPTLQIRVSERHVGQATIDPAAQTELALLCQASGFEVFDATATKGRQPDIRLEGEGFSEFGLRRGNLVSVKARVEVKAVEVATDKVLATDRQTTVVVDLTEQIAGKAALQQAAEQIALRLLPKLVKR